MAQQVENSVLEMALIGYEVERLKIESAMAAIRLQLGVRSTRVSAPAAAASDTAAKPKRTMSAAGRKAISDATKKRWAEFHAAEKGKKPAEKPKRKMSRATKAKLTANLAKARAAKAAKKAEESVQG